VCTPSHKTYTCQNKEIYKIPNLLQPGCSPAEIVGSNPAEGHGCLSVVSVVCCQVEVSATSRSLVQSSPTDCGVSLCVI